MGQQGSRRGSSGSSRSGGNSSRRSPRTRRSPKDFQEVEWQFDAAELEPAEGWLRHHSANSSGLVVEAESDEEISDTYYDTDDWRFYRAGYALRVRKTGGGEAEATMKTLSSAEGNVRRRREISEPLSDGKPATLVRASGPVGERSRALLGGREPNPMFKINTRRQSFALLLTDPDGGGSENGSGGSENRVRIGEVLLDSSEIPLGEGKESSHLSRVEVEAGPGTAPTPDLRGFVDEMQYALDLRPASISKFETGLYATGLSPEGATDAGPTEIGPTMTLGGVAFAVLRRQFAALRAHEPGTRIGEDPEELHDMRVATRRMRAAIKVFGAGLPERAKWFGEELRWVAGALGDVRDLDVQIGRLEAWKDETGGGETSEFLGKILDALRKRRTEARGRMLEVLDSGRYARFESSFAEMLRRGPGAERELARANGHDPAREPITSAAPDILSRLHRKWGKAAGRLGEGSPPEAFHDARKKGRRLRYTLEFLSEVYGKPTRRLIKPLKAVQDDLGDHQDAVVAANTLQELGTATGGPRVPRGVAFTMGMHAERYGREAAGLRSKTLGSKPFRALTRGKNWKDFQKTMKAGR